MTDTAAPRGPVTPALRAEALTKRYRPDAPPAVDGLDFAMPRGATWGLLGGNGAGKTTTIGMLLGRPAGELSAGQKTRVALAKALVNRPELLLLDEPTASLDPDTGDWVRSWLERYRAETGCAILLASHNMAEVERLCGHVLMLKQGRVVDRGSPAELLARYGRDDLEEVFLDIARDRRTAEVPA